MGVTVAGVEHEGSALTAAVLSPDAGHEARDTAGAPQPCRNNSPRPSPAATREGKPMKALEPAEASVLFERCFADGDLDGMMSLYEEGAAFPTPHGTSTGHEQIRATLKAYVDSGAKLAFGESLVFVAGDLALVHTPWTMTMPDGSTPGGATAEVVRRQSDGSWKYVIDNPDGSALLGHE